MKNYANTAEQYYSGYAELTETILSTASLFGKLVADATADGALPTKIKELIAFAIGNMVRCDGCITHHAQAVFEAGATRQVVAKMIGVAILMGGGPSSVYGEEALRVYDEFAEAKP